MSKLKNTRTWLSAGLFYCVLFECTAATIYSKSNRTITNWSDTDNWEGGIVPDADDYVIINNSTSIILNEDVSLISVTFNLGAGLTISDGSSLDLSGDFMLSGQDASLIIAGDVEANNYTASGTGASLIIEDTGSLALTSSTEKVLVNASNNSITISGAFTAQNDFSMGTIDAILHVESTGSFIIPGDFSLASNDVDVIIEGYFESGSLNAMNQNGYFFVKDGGNLVINGDVDLSDSTLELEGASEVHIKGGLTVSNSSGAVILGVGSAMDVDGDFTEEGDATVTVSSLGQLLIGGTIDSEDLDTSGGCIPKGSDIACGDAYLPIELLYFNYEIHTTSIVFNWVTVTELNNDYFILERSIDGTTYNVIATINGAGNSNERLTYEHEVTNPAIGAMYYRLRQVDFDGTEEVVGVIRVEFVFKDFMSKVYPNPTSGVIHYQTSRIGDINIYSSDGRSILVLENTAYSGSIDLSRHGLTPGIYQLNFGDSSPIKSIIVLNR